MMRVLMIAIAAAVILLAPTSFADETDPINTTESAILGGEESSGGSPSDASEQDPAPSAESNEPTEAENQAVNQAVKQGDAVDTTSRRKSLADSLTIFVLAIFLGYVVITKVPPTLHTPLMSGSNAISGITVVGALLVTAKGGLFDSLLGMTAVTLATVNVVGGFLVTHRMLAMFKRR